MGIESVIKAVQNFSKKNFSKPCKVITVKKEDENWIAHMEIVVEDEDMRKYARTPIIGLWEVRLDNDQNITSFERIGLKEATDLNYEEGEEIE
ncbi:MAG: gas vesicle protein [Candidatus Marinimicrobia bacterium]|nr:gas vesicle protein [Candidatus Neomarinimicrobiota bacterium]